MLAVSQIAQNQHRTITYAMQGLFVDSVYDNHIRHTTHSALSI
jgi:hypothetical protein